MENKVYNFELSLDWELLDLVIQIDRFDASWNSLEKIQGEKLIHLKSIATIQSVGASTRIEGSKLTDNDVEKLLKKIDISKFADRDSQEVAGYFNVLDLILKEYVSIELAEREIKNLHNLLLKVSSKDDWHRGNYKQHANAVAANFPDGSKQIIFRTTEPGIATEEEMRKLFKWHHEEKEVHALIKIAAFVYDFLSIHPFQDGNGRMSRLLTTLLLLKEGYDWIQYVSLEHEFENNKKRYYLALRICQAQRPNEDITEWISFFLSSLINVQKKLEAKLVVNQKTKALSPKVRQIHEFITLHPGCRSGEMAEALNMPNPSVKNRLQELLELDLIIRHGKGRGVNYEVK